MRQVAEDYAGKLFFKLFLGHTRELRHIRQIYLCLFIEGNCEGLHRAVNVGYLMALAYGAFIEYVRFSKQLALFTQYLK